MKAKTLAAILFFLLSIQFSAAQKRITINGKTTLTRDTVDRQYMYTIRSGAITNPADSDFVVIFRFNPQLSSLPGSDFTINSTPATLRTIARNGAQISVLTLNADHSPDRERTLVLQAEIYDASNTLKDTVLFSIKVNSIIDSSIKSYQYLVYLGTNFDLVDRINASKLFFASNVFIPPSKRKGNGMGMYLSIYGNRTMSATDSSGVVTRDARFAQNSDSTMIRYRERGNLVRTRVSDNLGAYFSPLIRLRHLNSRHPKQEIIRTFYAPSAEFVWRRTKTSSTFSNMQPYDSITEKHTGPLPPPAPASFNSYNNEFNFNIAPIGVFIAHETSRISVRVYCAVGYMGIYRPFRASTSSISMDEPYSSNSDIFFSGRAWITEASTGITLQGEVTNTLNNPRPAYVVTLSKALDFKALSALLSPLN